MALHDDPAASPGPAAAAGLPPADLLAGALARIPLGVWLAAEDGRVRWCNARANELAGAPATTAPPTRLTDALCRGSGDAPALAAAIAAALAEGRAFHAEVEGRTAEGTPCWRECWLDPVHDGAGRCTHWVAIVEDVSPRRRAEAALGAQRAAEQASAAKTVFLSRISHELRTPLNAVLGFAQLMRMDNAAPLVPAQATRLRQIEDAGQHLLGMIQDLLDVARIEHAQPAVATEDLVLAPVVDEALALVSAAAAERGVQVHLDAAPDGAALAVRADRLRLRQVLVNLLDNGIKYNRRGGCLDLRFGVNAAEPQRVRIDIRDQGPGLAAEQIEHMFEPFARLGAEYSAVEGLGLGLAISRQFVEAMGGRISVASTPGAGATFSVLLPRAALPVTAHAEPPDTGPPSAATLQTLTLLYVEDEPINALLLQDALLVRPGWTVLHAADAAAGLALAQACRPALVLSDIQLPGMSGLDLVRALRADPGLGGLLCIALSAGAMPEQAEQALAAGFDDYWTKPLDVCNLAERLESALAEAEDRRAPTEGVL